MTDAAIMLALFEGSDIAHGRSELTNEVDAKGKHKARSWTEKRPVNLQDWEQHLAGVKGIGIPPLNTKNMVRWGAIDVDVYQGMSLEALNTRIQSEGLPLIICRSKSGGPHIYLFVKEWIPAKQMIDKLDLLAGHLGFATSEIFPKQAMITVGDKAPDFGSWINMPYFGGTQYLRYALAPDNTALATPAAFAAYVATKSLTLEQFAELRPTPTPGTQNAADATGQPAEPLPDGPPCLNRLLRQGVGDMRNIILSNIAVYCKKAFGEAWSEHLEQFNRLFPHPLDAGEVEAIKKSYAKKDYRYQCQKQPMRSFCSVSACKRCKHGIGGQDFLPAKRSLSMVMTSPRIWYLDIQKPDETDVRISLSTEELQSSRLFQRRCMEAVQQMPPVLKQEDWEPIVEGLMAHVSIIEVPPEMTPQGQMKEHLIEFLSSRATTETMDSLVRGIPYRDNQYLYFRFKDFSNYLKQQRFDLMKPHEVTALLKEGFQAMNQFRRISGVGIRHLSIPINALPEAIEEPETLPVPPPTNPI